MKNTSILRSSLAFGLMATASLHAGIIAWDDFESSTLGALSGQSGGDGWTAAWVADSTTQVVSKSMNYSAGEISISGGSQAVFGSDPSTGSFSASRLFDEVTGGGTVYMSLLFERVGDLSGDVLDFNLGDNPANYRPSAGVDVQGVYNNSMYAAGGGTIIRTSTGVSVTSSTDLLVVRLSSGAEGYTTLDVLINPTTITEPATGWTTTNITLGEEEYMMDSLNAFLIRNVNLDPGDGFYMDNLIISDSYSDVVNPIPEPSGIAWFGGLGALAFVITRRRRL
ncbi:MAG: hypothetical protein ACQKBT_04860 [Puniceicoccales bacterium]